MHTTDGDVISPTLLDIERARKPVAQQIYDQLSSVDL